MAFEGKHGGRTTPKITALLGQPRKSEDREREYASLCGRLAVTPANKPRTYWVLPVDALPQLEKNIASEDSFDFPDEVSSTEIYPEGAVKRVLVNAYERNPRARKACVQHYGVTCAACDFNFEETYGDIGSGFIHVHHRKPLALLQETYRVDPVKDLCPVCPNCHAMLHRSDPPFSVEELKELLESRRDH